MAFNKDFFDRLRQSGVHVSEPISVRVDPDLDRAVRRFIQKIERAHSEAAKSKLHFGICPN